MISISKKFIFIHVPKTGGNSIQNVIKEYSEDDIVILAKHQDGVERFEVRNKKYDITKHSTLSDYKSVMEPEIYRELFRFATIRNPWDMMVSFYFSPHRGVTSWDRVDFIKLLKEVPTIRHYICDNQVNPEGLSGANIVNTPYHGCGGINKDIDFLIRFECLQEDFEKLCLKINIKPQQLPRRNVSSHNHYSSYYDEELIKMVHEKFFEEIEFGEYKFERI